MPATVERSIRPDPERPLSRYQVQDGELAYILAPQRIAAGDKSWSRRHVDVKPGNAHAARNIPIVTLVHNSELKLGKGGISARPSSVHLCPRSSTRGAYVSSGSTRPSQRCPRPPAMAPSAAVDPTT